MNHADKVNLRGTGVIISGRSFNVSSGKKVDELLRDRINGKRLFGGKFVIFINDFCLISTILIYYSHLKIINFALKLMLYGGITFCCLRSVFCNKII